LSELAAAIDHSHRLIEQSGLIGSVQGHVGDGNYHTLVVLDPSQSEDWGRAEQLNAAIVEYALSRKGTCTGEHGVGLGKRKYQYREHGPALDVMRSIKKTLDPKGILNPEKIFPPIVAPDESVS
jgi:D-lactate dehydrogenase (cytochrome)